MTDGAPDLLAALQASIDRAREARHESPADLDVSRDPFLGPEAPLVRDPSYAPRPTLPGARRNRRRRGMTQSAKVRRVPCPDEPVGCGAAAGAPCRDVDGEPRQPNHQARVKAHKAAYPRHESMNAAGGAARDHYGRDLTGASGARFDGECDRCGESLTVGSGGIVQRKGRWIHAACAPGADDA